MRKIFSISILLLFITLFLQNIVPAFASNNKVYVDHDIATLLPSQGGIPSTNEYDDFHLSATLKSYKATGGFYNHGQKRSIATNTYQNTLISGDNPDYNDANPTITRNSAGTFVVTYEKYYRSYAITNPIVFSTDQGENWHLGFNVSSQRFNLSDRLIGPNIVYNSNLNVFYYNSIDPDADMYNDIMGFIPGDISNVDDMLLYAMSACGDRYLENAAATTENFFLSVTIRSGYLDRYLDAFYLTYPNFEIPDGMGGLYPDYESVHKTSPASNIEMDTGNRIYLVAESGVEGGPKITVKSTTADEELLTNGEQQNGMDKYADMEQWPGEYVANGTDPDVSAFGNKVYIVYNQNGTVKCSYSTAESGYEPHFNWQVSTVASNGATCPAVYTYGDKIICAYVKNGNLFIVISEDGGASWGVPSQINEVNGTVAEDAGSIDLYDVGVVWTDTRNGDEDIYFELLSGNEGFFIPQIHISGGLGITILIENLGNLSKQDIWWTANLDAFYLVAGATKGNVSLDAYDSIALQIPVFGFGKIKVETVCEYNGYASAHGFLIGPFVQLSKL
jgi:hypothetical protein